jgi:hypothetical protein
MSLGVGILELPSGNQLVNGPTDRQTDGPTDMYKAIYLILFEGGHNNMFISKPF